MSIATKNRIATGFRTLAGGVDSGRDPSSIGDGQCAFAVNATFRGGFVQCRPGFSKVPLNYQADSDLQAAVEDNFFQGCAIYKPQLGTEYLIASISGRQFRFNVAGDFKVREFTAQKAGSTPGTFVPNPGLTYAEINWFCQAEQFMVIQDGLSAPLIYTGGIARRSVTIGEIPEVPPGEAMAYGQGRLCVIRPGGQGFVFGDIVGGPSGTSQYGFKDGVIKFSENDFLNEGGDFSIPTEAGRGTSMKFLAVTDTSLGQGPLQVFTARAGFSVAAPVDRTTWKDLTYPIETKSLSNFGPIAERSVVNVNSDIWYRAPDGIRSFMVARRDFNQTYSNTAMSYEMNRVIVNDDPKLIKFASGASFDNRLLMTLAPKRVVGHGIIFRGLGVLDFAPLTSMQGKGSPAWDGLWTGLNFLQIIEGEFAGVSRCFAFVLSADNKIEIWELSKDFKMDIPAYNSPRRIDWWVETKSYGFTEPQTVPGLAPSPDVGQFLKRLEGADLWIDQLYDRADVAISYLPNQFPFWEPWNSFSVCAKVRQCEENFCAAGPTSFQDQYRARQSIPAPSNDCDPNASRPFRDAYEFSMKIAVSGFCRLRMFRVYSSRIQEREFDGCGPSEESCKSSIGCEENLFTYSSYAS